MPRTSTLPLATAPARNWLAPRLREQQLCLGGRQDREALLVGGEEPAELVRGGPRRLVAPLRGDQLDLPFERIDGGLLERASREEGSGDDRDDDRDEHGAGDAEEEARPERAHPGTSL